MRDKIAHLQDLEFPTRGALSETEVHFNLPGYIFTPYVSNMYRPPRPIRDKYQTISTRPKTDFGPCPTCGRTTLIDPFFVNRKRSHVTKCRIKHDQMELTRAQSRISEHSDSVDQLQK